MLKTLIFVVAPFLFTSVNDGSGLKAALIVNPTSVTGRVGAETFVYDSAKHSHSGPNLGGLSPNPAPSSFTVSPLSSSIADANGDSASGQTGAYSYSYGSSSIQSFGSSSVDGTLGSGEIMQPIGFSRFMVQLFTVDHTTPFTLTSTLSINVTTSPLGVDNGRLFADVILSVFGGAALVTDQLSMGTQEFSNTGTLAAGTLYALTSEEDTLPFFHSATYSDSGVSPAGTSVAENGSYSFSLIVPEPSSIALLSIGAICVATLACRGRRGTQSSGSS